MVSCYFGMYRESSCADLSYNSFNSKTTFTCTSEIFCFDLKQNISKEEIDIYNLIITIAHVKENKFKLYKIHCVEERNYNSNFN